MGQVVWIWMTRLIRKLMFEDDKIPQALCKNIHDQLFQGRDAIRRTNCYLDTQFPMPYVHILSATVHVFHIIIAVVAGINFTVGWDDGSTSKMVLQFVVVMVFGVLYEGILSIARKLQNPLGNHNVDLN